MSYDVLEALRATGAILEGHFELSSGKHSGVYFQCARLLAQPSHGRRIGNAIASLFSDREIDVVVAPAIGGIVLSYVVADALGVRSLFAERDGTSFVLRRGFELQPSQRVLVVEDVVTTAGSAMAVADLVRSLDAQPIGIGTIVQRSTTLDLNLDLRALLTLDAPISSPERCLLCAAGSIAHKPGSRPD